ncbi:cation diffusion facilitator family transporter [Thomasclavelia sp.]
MENYKKTVFKVSTITLIGNVILSVFKILIGFICGSNAIVSDGIHSASDVLSTVVVMIGVRLSSKESDKEHPYGHERFECVAAIILSVMLFLTASIIGYTAIKNLFVTNNKIHFGMLAIIIAIISIISKEAMYWYTKINADRINSNALLADAWHHRSDAFSSVGSLIGVVGFYYGYYILDCIAGIVICLCIYKVTFDIFNDAINKMIDHACSEDFENELISLIKKQDGVLGIDDFKTRMFGNKIYVDIEIKVAGDDSLQHAHLIAHKTHDVIENIYPIVKHCNIHVNPGK